MFGMYFCLKICEIQAEDIGLDSPI